MGPIAGIIVGFAVFIGVNTHHAMLQHEKDMQSAFDKQIQQKKLALAKARSPKPVLIAKINGIEVADLSGEEHA